MLREYCADYEAVDNALLEAASGSKTAAAITKTFRNYGIVITKEMAAKARQIYSEAAVLPTEYFEAKTQRAVNLGEIKNVIVPDNSTGLIESLQSAGIPHVTYETGNEEDRLEKLNGTENVKFSFRDNIITTESTDEERAAVLEKMAITPVMVSDEDVKAVEGMNLKELSAKYAAKEVIKLARNNGILSSKFNGRL